jgi:hypothetical protein
MARLTAETKLQWAILALLAVTIFAGLMTVAYSSDYTRDGGTADWMCCSDRACTTVISQHADPVRAENACGKLTDADGVTRYTRSNAFRITKPGAPPPTCPPKPADQQQTAQCPTGTTGSWTQTQTYASAPPPTCWTPSGFLPTDPPAGACVAVPPPTPGAPANLTATVAPNQTNPSNSNVTLTWTAVNGTTMYEVFRCTGVGCTGFAWFADVPGTSYINLNLPPNLTYRYKVRAWQPVTGPFTENLSVATLSSPPPQLGSATLTISKPAQNTDGTALTDLVGFRVLYGTSAAALTQTAALPVASDDKYSIAELAAGSWYFAVRALAGNAACLQPGADCFVRESAQTGVASKVVQ